MSKLNCSVNRFINDSSTSIHFNKYYYTLSKTDKDDK